MGDSVNGQPLGLHCPYCGSDLQVTQRTAGRAYHSWEEVDAIECADQYGGYSLVRYAHCHATWEPNGTPRDLPDYIRFPDLYTKPIPA